MKSERHLALSYFDETNFDSCVALDRFCLGATDGLLPSGECSASEDAGCGTDECIDVYGVQGLPRSATAGSNPASFAKRTA